MSGRHIPLGRLGLAAGVVWACWAGGGVQAQPVPVSAPADAAGRAVAAFAPRWVPVDSLPEHVRDGVRKVLEHPTVQARGPVEIFRADPLLYQWLLNHPDRGVQAWRKLGAKCMEITDRGRGVFGWADGQGCDVHWETVYSSPLMRIWYAEGEARPGALLPQVPVRAVAVLRYSQATDGLGRTVLRHQAEIFCRTDSKAAALFAQLMGASAPLLARHCVGQMELFFSGPVAYVDRHPERTEELLLAGLRPDAPAARELQQILECKQAARSEHRAGE